MSIANLKNLEELLKQKDNALKNFKMNKNNFNNFENYPNSYRNQTTNISYSNQVNFTTQYNLNENSNNNLLIKSNSNYLNFNKNLFSSSKKNQSNQSSYKKHKFSNFTNEKEKNLRKNFHSYSKDKYHSNEDKFDYEYDSNYKLTPIEYRNFSPSEKHKENFNAENENENLINFPFGKFSSPKFYENFNNKIKEYNKSLSEENQKNNNKENDNVLINEKKENNKAFLQKNFILKKKELKENNNFSGNRSKTPVAIAINPNNIFSDNSIQSDLNLLSPKENNKALNKKNIVNNNKNQNQGMQKSFTIRELINKKLNSLDISFNSPPLNQVTPTPKKVKKIINNKSENKINDSDKSKTVTQSKIKSKYLSQSNYKNKNELVVPTENNKLTLSNKKLHNSHASIKIKSTNTDIYNDNKEKSNSKLKNKINKNINTSNNIVKSIKNKNDKILHLKEIQKQNPKTSSMDFNNKLFKKTIESPISKNKHKYAKSELQNNFEIILNKKESEKLNEKNDEINKSTSNINIENQKENLNSFSDKNLEIQLDKNQTEENSIEKKEENNEDKNSSKLTNSIKSEKKDYFNEEELIELDNKFSFKGKIKFLY